MASTSARRGGMGDGVTTRIRTAATTLSSENGTLLADIRRSIGLMKDVAVEMEKLNKTQEVKKLENAVLELLNANDESTHFFEVMQTIGNSYQSGPELTNFKKLLEDEVSKLNGRSSSDPQKHPLLRQFREAVWNVHHAGQPMPGEEQEDIVMTSTQVTLLNTTCPLSGKPVTELKEPVRSMDCKHIYEKEAILYHIRTRPAPCKCPMTGCPKIVQVSRVVCDPLLPVEIEEHRALSNQIDRTAVIEDFTELDDEN